MKPRAIIFDVYGTLLRIRPPGQQPELGWVNLYQAAFGTAPRLSQTEAANACRNAVARQHERAKARGVGFPEVVWPSILREVFPEISVLEKADQDEFVFQHSQLTRTLELASHATALLPRWRASGIHLGVASNAQAYTLREMDEKFAEANLSWRELLEPHLCFWSFEHGFSKPNAHVFQILTARLEQYGINRQEILMVGDRLDNDIEPAEAHGWQAWWLTANPGRHAGGSWEALCDSLKE